MIPRSRLGLNCLTRDPSGVLARDARCRLLICKSLRIAEVSRDGAGLPYEDSMQYGISVLRLQRKPACRQYRAARWFLLAEAGLRQRLDGRSCL